MSKIQVNTDVLETVDIRLEQALSRQGATDPHAWIGDKTAADLDEVFVTLSDTSKEMSETVSSFVSYLHDVAKTFKERESELSGLFTSFKSEGASKLAQQALQVEASRQSKYYHHIL